MKRTFIHRRHWTLVLYFTVTMGLPLREAHGQPPRRISTNGAFWTETVLSGRISDRWLYQLDYQYRRQGVSEKLRDSLRAYGRSPDGAGGIFKYPLQQVIRPWIHYEVSQRLRVGISPLGWWGVWTPGVERFSFQPELRTTVQAATNHSLGRVTLTQRVRYEFRFFGKTLSVDDSGNHYTNFTNDDNRRGRFRYQLRATVPLNRPSVQGGTFYVNASNEIFLGVGPNVHPDRVLDQNRLALLLGYKFGPLFRLEMGYLNQWAPRESTGGVRNADLNHVWQVSLQVDDFNALLRKKSRPQR